MRRKSHGKPAQPAQGPAPMQVATAYSVCRSISRAAARNFYYAFLALPREKRDAMCAVYAFMRHADDISDEPGAAPAIKRARLADWLASLQRVTAGESTNDPVLLALADAQRRYDIPAELLEKLVAGTAMDLDLDEPALVTGSAGEPPAAVASVGSPEVFRSQEEIRKSYETFADLYQYCYHVASVVGLVCIRIFGYQDAAAEPLAERCGIAFQLTNIIRDVQEDASMGRVYLPKEDLVRFGLSAADLSDHRDLPSLASRFRPLLEFEGDRARDFYRSAEELIPLIEEDSQPALWVLVTIYRRLLEKIAANNYDVFSNRVRLTTMEKLKVLARGCWLRFA